MGLFAAACCLVACAPTGCGKAAVVTPGLLEFYIHPQLPGTPLPRAPLWAIKDPYVNVPGVTVVWAPGAFAKATMLPHQQNAYSKSYTGSSPEELGWHKGQHANWVDENKINNIFTAGLQGAPKVDLAVQEMISSYTCAHEFGHHYWGGPPPNSDGHVDGSTDNLMSDSTLNVLPLLQNSEMPQLNEAQSEDLTTALGLDD
jgi:hypothetical protein